MQTVLIFDDIRAFVAVAQCGNISDAAAALCIAQPALSKRVKRLEQRIGVVLMVRVRRIPYLTVVSVRYRQGDEAGRMRHAKSGHRSRAWQCAG